jgi:hypothetical protein
MLPAIPSLSIAAVVVINPVACPATAGVILTLPAGAVWVQRPHVESGGAEGGEVADHCVSFHIEIAIIRRLTLQITRNAAKK